MSLTITTIVPTFHRPDKLDRAINSALSQSYRDLIVSVYDNASGDSTQAVVQRLAEQDARVRYIRRSENIGAAANFIRAFNDVTTPLCSFLSDDDYLLPGFFERAGLALHRDEQAGMFAGSTLEHDESGTLRYAPLLSWPREGRYEAGQSVLRMFGNQHPTWTGIVFRTEALRAAGGLDPAASAALDFDAELRVAAMFPIIVSFAPSAIYTVHPGSVSSGETARVIPAFERMIDKTQSSRVLPVELRRKVAAGLQRQLQMKLLEISVKAQLRGDRAAAREAALLLRDTHGSPWLGSLSVAGLWFSNRVPAAHALLASLERGRVARRAARARRQVAALG